MNNVMSGTTSGVNNNSLFNQNMAMDPLHVINFHQQPQGTPDLGFR